MIIVYHNSKHVVSVINDDNTLPVFSTNTTLTEELLNIAKANSNQLLIWCHIDLKELLNISQLTKIFHHNYILATFHPFSNIPIHDAIGYIDRSFYIKINTSNTYPTWLMSAWVGGILSSTLIKFSSIIETTNSFNYNLLSIAKLGQNEGLLCYSEPKLLINNPKWKAQQFFCQTTLFKFVKTHYKWFWVWYLCLCYFLYEKKFPFLDAIKTVFLKRLTLDFNFDNDLKSTKKIVKNGSIDVIIPTIGRKDYLFNVLKDLSKQTFLPKSVIIVEQNPKLTSKSDLSYINTEIWPFKIIHHFIHQLGVVNARNIALKEVTSEWVLLGDDDNRFEPNLIEKLFEKVTQYGVKCGLTVYLKPGETQYFLKSGQTPIFGGGNAILKSDLLNKVKFNSKFEFSYGEDTDFGMQIRHTGEDVIYFSDVIITHLKAPFGGFRTKFIHPWDSESIQPLPSPAIMYLHKKYYTHKQLKGYKLLYFIRRFKQEKVINFIAFISKFNKQWVKSDFWSKKM
ncbi:glycosyltransferase family A protein [Olleya sp. AS48]|uniref:glycosyltransferase family 2 protein n=1 Tax=Olleya sp. AS48 TaxID=3135774 RepID=UPI003173CDAD